MRLIISTEPPFKEIFMIKTEEIENKGRIFIRTYSSKNVYIHGGSPEADYSEAIDPSESGRTYTETKISIEEV